MKTARLSIGTFEAKNRFSELIERVGRGAEIIVTKHDKPVAQIIPPSDAAAEGRQRAVAELRQMRHRYHLNGIRAKELIGKGRR